MSRGSGRLAAGERTNLPAELTPFVGRDRELAALVPLLHDARLLSLLGPAGIGKTRLALRLASTVRRQYPDGVWWVQLAPVTDGDLLPAVIAGVLGIPQSRSGETLAVLDAALSPRRMLLVLDNSEHLVDPVAVVVDHLLQTCPQLTVLTTSRERIGLVGESVWRVPPLAVPDRGSHHDADKLERTEAVVLFLDRAHRVNPAFSIVPANAEEVAELVRRLDGLPLALELAATWMEALSPAELAQELDNRYGVLVGRRIVSDRHPSLWAAIDSTYGRLDPAAQDLLRQLGVFAGGWNLGAMTSVCRLESGPAVEVLGRLVDHSFVQVVPTAVGPTRYRLLEVLRRFALDRLDEAGELEATSRRFVDYMASVLERAASGLASREAPRWMTMLDADLDNIRAVFATDRQWPPASHVRLAACLVPYWLLRGLADEGSGYLRAALAGARGPSSASVDALNGLSWLAWAQGDLGVATRRARAAFRAARRCGDRHGGTHALLRLAQAQFDSARPATAGRTTVRAQEIAAELDDRRLTAECLQQLGQVALAEQRLDEAERLVSESIRLLSEVGPLYRLSNAYVTLGRIHLQQGSSRAAEDALRQSLTVARDLAMVRPAFPMLETLAAVAADRGDHRRAARLAGAAAGLIDRIGARPPATAPLRTAVVARWQAALRRPGAAEAFAEGREMDLQGAIAYALGRPAPPAGPSTGRRATPHHLLTKRQMTVARMVARGLSSKEIAKQLGISERTVEGHVEQIFYKLGFNSRAQIGNWIGRYEELT